MKKSFTRIAVLAAALTMTCANTFAQDETDYTSRIVNADLTATGGWKADGTKGIDGSGIVKCGNNAQFDFSQTITALPAGQYRLTASAAYRYSGSEQAEYDAIQAGTETKLATLYATVGEETVATPVMNRYDGASKTDYAEGSGSTQVNNLYVPNSSNAVKAWFQAGQYRNELEFTMPAEGNVTIGIAKSAQPEAGDYTVIGPWTLTRIGDAPDANLMEVVIDHERMATQGYTASVATVDFAEAKAFLGVDKLTTSMIRIENPDGELISDYAPFDGWFNTKGEAETWQDLNAEAVEADKAGICVKFFQAVENGSTFEVCDMNNADEVGKTYTVRWQLVNGEKAVRFVVNVTFVEFQQPIYKPEIIATVDVPATMKPAKEYEGATATFDAAAIAEALGLTTLADARAYIVNVTDGNFVDNFTDGWRNADGDAAKWGTSAAMVCVKVSDPASGIIDYLGAIDTSYAEGSTYTAKWGFVNDDEKAVVMNVNITFTDGITDAIQAPETASRPADVYNLQGQKLRHAAKGLNIVGGRKVIF